MERNRKEEERGRREALEGRALEAAKKGFESGREKIGRRRREGEGEERGRGERRGNSEEAGGGRRREAENGK